MRNYSISIQWRQAIALFLLCVNAQVFAENIVIGGNFGYASNRNDITYLNEYFSDTATQALASNDDNNRKAWLLYLNYPVVPRIAAQIGYADLGGANTFLVGPETEVEPYLERINGYPIDNVKGVFLAATYQIELNDAVNVVAKGGLHYWRADFVIQSHQTRLGFDEEGIDPMVGLGLQLNMTHQLAATTTWELYTPDNHNFDLMTLGLAWRFR